MDFTGELHLTLEQLIWGAGVLVASVIIFKYTLKAVRDIVENAKAFVINTVGERPDIQTEVKAALTNGGGDIIRSIVKSENMDQSEKHKDEIRLVVNEAIRIHEMTEERKLGEQLEKFRGEMYGALPKDRRNRH